MTEHEDTATEEVAVPPSPREPWGPLARCRAREAEST